MSRRRIRGWPVVAVLAWTLVIGGCRRGPSWDLASVEGIVTMSGSPLVGVEVVFIPDGQEESKQPRFSGITDASGHYVLRRADGECGAVAGRYRVCIRRNENDPNGSSMAKFARVLYGRFERTPLRGVQVHAGSQTLDFDLQPPQRSK